MDIKFIGILVAIVFGAFVGRLVVLKLKEHKNGYTSKKKGK